MTMVNPVSSGAGAAQPQSSGSGSGLTSLSASDFLKLLVTQLTNQDPTNPLNPTQMISQTSTLTMVEDITQMNQSLSAMESGQQLSQAVSMLSKQVSYQLPGASATQSGTVSSVQMVSGTPMLMVNGSQVPLSAITSVS
ncbi:MAG: flagellar hook capping protein [Actinomycetota bacterium]|nr:flagellar hook capping protein [Actinomycetota bacterium]